jgi:hypothetical protein
MRISAAKTLAVMGVATVAALGTQYASAAPSSPAQGAHNTVTAALPNIDYQYSTNTTGGTGDVVFTIPNPPKGFYYASFTANFYPQASQTFSCSLIKDGTTMRAQSTVASLSDSGFYAGVNGGNAIKIDGIAQFYVHCGTADGSAWDWGTRPVQVNLIRLDGAKAGNLSGGVAKVHDDLSVVGSH